MKDEKSAVSVIVEMASGKLNAAKKTVGLGELERELIRRNIQTSRTQLSNALKGITDTLSTDVLFECLDIGFEGDWNKARRALKRSPRTD